MEVESDPISPSKSSAGDFLRADRRIVMQERKRGLSPWH